MPPTLSYWFTRRRPSSSSEADPLDLAIRSLRLLGILSVIIGGGVVVLLGILNRYTLYRPHFLAIGTLVWLAPGVLYLASIAPLRRGKFPALIASLVAAGLQTLCAAGFVVAQFILRPITFVPLLLSVLWLIAMIELLLQLRHAFIRLRFAAMERELAFEVLPVMPNSSADHKGESNGPPAQR